MKSIASRQNPWFKRVRDAVREHAAEIVIEGPKAVADAVAAGWEPIAIVECGGHAAALARESGGAATLQMTDELFRAVSDTKTSQGVLALFHRPENADVFAMPGIVVALDGVQDPGNVGTIIRLAAAFNAAGVALLPGCADPFSPKAIRASAGAILSVPIASVPHLDPTSRPLFYADSHGDTVPLPKNAVLVLGSEGRGVSEDIRHHGTPIGIATSGRVESLNVAAAAAILLWSAAAKLPP